MCTAVTFSTKDHYFGRNLDYEFSCHETVTVTPRNYPFTFRDGKVLKNHYAMIGIAMIDDGYPLYYDATNEKGLSMAGLNFPGNAVYKPLAPQLDNVSPFEFIPWILGQCTTVTEAEEYLNRINLAAIPFSDVYPLSPLHWIIADKTRSITVESVSDGLHVMENPVGILTNNPPFAYHLYNLSNFINVTHKEPINRFSDVIDLTPYSRGMGGMGLPGDLSSSSRFVKAAFTKLNSRCGDSESESISQFFHILSSVAQQRGCVQVDDGFEKTVYSSCCNVDKGIYYYTTYENSQITGISLFKEDLDSHELVSYTLLKDQQIRMEN